jgi:hypothetical protein
MNLGRTVFSQLVDFLATCQFQICVDRYQGIATSNNSPDGISSFVWRLLGSATRDIYPAVLRHIHYFDTEEGLRCAARKIVRK